MKKKVFFPLQNKNLEKLKLGDEVEIYGIIYSARDSAHKKFFEDIRKKRELPFNLNNSLIYYMGPSPAPSGKIIGSCGPTTSSRMDEFTIPLLKLGLKATMGKGERSIEIVNACKQFKAVYFITYGGCGAYLNKFIKEFKLIAYPELGPEAVYMLKVEKFPAIVGIDIWGNDLYQYCKKV